MNNYGFIILRHVNDNKTNNYWNRSAMLIRKLYPLKKIVIIDDNSNYEYVKSLYPIENLEVVQSEYPGRGELLPYIYFLRNQWFNNAIIIHDSTFIHKRINFDRIKQPILPLWHFDYDRENLDNLLRLSRLLKGGYRLSEYLLGNHNVLNVLKSNYFIGIFGVQTYINHHYLKSVDYHFNISGLIRGVHNRSDRCGLERIFGLIFCLTYKQLGNYKSLFGNIHKTGEWGLTYDQYIQKIKNKSQLRSITKVWTGR